MNKSRKIEDIQALRAIAILFVLVHHINGSLITMLDPIWSSPFFQKFYSYFGGEVGVDLFFVISGFVIARGILPKIENNWSSGNSSQVLIVFWAKRAFRLLPSAWFWLSMTIIFSILFNSSGAFGTFRSAFEGAVAGVLNVANIRFMECYGYFECGPSVVYWSLSLEEQFYLIFPVIAIILRKNLTIALMILLLSQFFEYFSVPGVFRFTGLVLGVLIAIFSRSDVCAQLLPKAPNKYGHLKTVMIGFLFLLLATVLGPDLHIVSGSLKYDMAALISGVLVLLASYNRNFMTGNGLLRQVLLYFGARSYAIYLVHMPAFYLTREVFFVSNQVFISPLIMLTAYISLAFTLTLIMAELSYQFVENYWQQRGSKIISRLSARGETS